MKKLLTLITLVMVFFIVDFFVSAFYGYFVEEFERRESATVVDTQPQTREKKNFQSLSFYRPIARRDLFKTENTGRSEKKQIAASLVDPNEKIRLTTLQLELKGTITGTGSESFAVIKKKTGPGERLYAINEKVDRAVIKEIFRQRVVLLVDGREETLLMHKSKDQENFKAPLAKTVEKKLLDTISLTWSDVDPLKTDLKTLRQQVRVRPHFYKGTIDGFRVTRIRKDSIFSEKLKLRNGDIIAAVNGEPIKSVNDIVRFYNGFKEMDSKVVTDVDIKRNGMPGKIRYKIE